MSVYCYFPHSFFFFFLSKKWTLLTAAIQTVGKSEYYNLWLQKPWIAIFRHKDLNSILHFRRKLQTDGLSRVLLVWRVPCRGCSSAAPGWSHREPGPLGALEERCARLEAVQSGCRPAELWASWAHAHGGRAPHWAVLLPRLHCSHGHANRMDATDTANSFPATVQGGPASQLCAAELQHTPTSPEFQMEINGHHCG